MSSSSRLRPIPRERPVTVRTWTRAGGDGPAGIRFTRRGTAYTYELLVESGTVIEVGDVVLPSVEPAGDDRLDFADGHPPRRLRYRLE